MTREIKCIKKPLCVCNVRTCTSTRRQFPACGFCDPHVTYIHACFCLQSAVASMYSRILEYLVEDRSLARCGFKSQEESWKGLRRKKKKESTPISRQRSRIRASRSFKISLPLFYRFFKKNFHSLFLMDDLHLFCWKYY